MLQLTLLFKVQKAYIEASPLWTFGQLREHAARTFGLHPDTCCLRFRGRRVPDEYVLGTAGIKNGATVVVSDSEEHREHLSNSHHAQQQAAAAAAAAAAGGPASQPHAASTASAHAQHRGRPHHSHATGVPGGRTPPAGPSPPPSRGPTPPPGASPARSSAPASPSRPQPTVLESIARVGREVDALEAEVRRLQERRGAQEEPGPLRKSAAMCVEALTQKMLVLDNLEVDSESRAERKRLLTRIIAISDSAEALAARA